MPNQVISRRQFFLGDSRSILPDRGNSRSTALLPHMDASGYTPTAQFFSQQIGQIVELDALYWTIRLDGLVKTPATFTLDDLHSLPAREVPCTLVAFGNSTRNTLVGHALWEGVPFSDLLSNLGVLPEARYAYVTAADGYSTCLAIEALENALLAYRMNGDVLSAEQGYPARLVVPGLYDYKMPKWIRHIEFSHTPIHGYWESRGASLGGEVEPMAAIFTPHHLETVKGTVSIVGIAYAGQREITAIEVSIDHAPWMPVDFDPVPQYTWTPWAIEWTPYTPGDSLIQVRASSGQSDLQGLHSVTVRVV